MNLEPRDFNLRNGEPPCQTRGCGHEWFEHGDDEHDNSGRMFSPCIYCPCKGYREEPLERDEYEPYDY